ncbi:MAG: 3' terminal RNA ribose 2'-O-methyltransferase Hen1 [Planctomycetota bacterium]
MEATRSVTLPMAALGILKRTFHDGDAVLLTISANSENASDLSYLLHKHPDRFQTFDVSFGQAHVFYRQVTDRCVTACLLLEVDPVGMARKNRARSNQLISYVNDRPFVTSSFMSTAIASVFGSAMAGRCKDRPTAATTPMELTVRLESLPVKGGEDFLRRLFEPLGYDVDAASHPLDERFPDWGESQYFSVQLQSRKRLSEVLNHLYVLIPVFDNQKHYFVAQDEMDKLLSKGAGWLETHPCKEAITRRYLRHQRGMIRQALECLTIKADGIDDDSPDRSDEAEIAVEPNLADSATAEKSLNEQRHETVVGELIASGARRVADLGCGEGKLLRRLMKQKQFTQIVGMDVSVRALEMASKRLRMDSLPPMQADRIELLHGSLMYRDARLSRLDAACLVEVIEHLDPPRLAAMQRVVFQHARPKVVLITTPNVEYNVVWESLPAGQFRHGDHRFEWTRDEFQRWSTDVASQHGYEVRFEGIGPQSDDVGTPTQMAIFKVVSASDEPCP